MTYYLLLEGDSEKDVIYETNVLGEESFNTFYPSVGFMILPLVGLEHILDHWLYCVHQGRIQGHRKSIGDILFP